MTEAPTRPLHAVTARPRELAAGDVVDDWVVASELGSGGFGAVYAARHRRTGEICALKLLHAHLMSSAEMVARFQREIRLIQLLDHPSIVRLVASGALADGRPYLCMELVDGDELGAVITSRGHLTPAEALDVLDPLCDALALAHARGVIHRDVKAGNVIVCGDGRIVLLDFGIAKLSDAFATELTATSQSLGTPSCMAPEQIYGRRTDARTDVYGVGALLFHMLTGQQPLVDASPTMTQYLHLHARRPRVSSVVPMPTRFYDIVIRAMAIDPAERFGDTRELLAVARAAVRASAFYPAVQETDASAILATVGDRGGAVALDAATLADLEAAMPHVERLLGEHGFALTIDLGATALFAGRLAPGDAVTAALATWAELQRVARHPRVQISLCVHHGQLLHAGGELQPSPLLRPSTWEVPEGIEGVWVTRAIAPGAPAGQRIA